MKRRQPTISRTGAEPRAVADQLHGAAIRLLRMLRSEDAATGLSGPRASALSVVVFRGPLTMSELAAAEQVRLPTISRLVAGLEHEGLVARAKDAHDARVQRVTATAKGRKLLLEGKARRVERLAAELRKLSPRDRDVLRRAAPILESLVGTRAHPKRAR